MSKSYLKQFRETHMQELEKCMVEACKIRDDKKATARDKNEAIKIIARLLSALQPDKSGADATAKTTGKTQELSPEMLKRIHDEYGPKPTPGVNPNGDDPIP